MSARPAIAVSAASAAHVPQGAITGGELIVVDPATGMAPPAGIEVLWRRQPDRTKWLVDCVARLPDLRWIHTETAGVDRLPLRELAERGIALTNAGQAYAPAVAEWTVGALLLAARRLDHTVRSSDDGQWDTGPLPRQLAGTRVVIVGLGAIGCRVASACAGLEIATVGVTRGGAAAATVEQRQHVDRIIGADGFAGALAGAAALVVCAPLTPGTRGLVDAAVLEALPRDAWLINAARGELVDEVALIAALDRGELAGAILDTFADEPLPPDHPLWGRENVLVSPHVAGRSDRAADRALAGFVDELDRYRRGVAFADAVDLDRGY